MITDPDNKFAFQLDWNLLRTFLVIAEEQSITRAAHRLLRGQPAVSLALKRLETELDCRLVERGKGEFRLTSAGRRLYSEAGALFHGVSQLPDSLGQARNELSGDVRILVASHVITPLLDRQLTHFAQHHPKVRFSIRVETSGNVIQEVRERQASLGICLVNRQLPDLEYMHMYREFFGFFCGRTNPLFGREGLKMDDLRDHPFVAFDTEEIDNALRQIVILRNDWGLTREVTGRSSQLEEVRRMVMCGMGIGAFPVHVVQNDVERGLLWRLPPYEAPPAVDIFLIVNPRKHMNRAEDKFVGDLMRAIRKTPLDERTYLA
ncbi:LysR family transcriptional regulator [Aestuariicoccus sp. MJ-SS9]|uniref:LysR family transcriptional regulator n=1 Tax=Aestuariicoccus sp. MJ-SS9 TaxID=3079855 RepID=UPI0029121617|nr:LysR family transcriptional regulator [Aestuariicoccus sp. MJ-SS9]MDU8913689.1 LysR family transcriptional regulator [Aestuariicoccus sp. MJ-SS9]